VNLAENIGIHNAHVDLHLTLTNNPMGSMIAGIEQESIRNGGETAMDRLYPI